MWRKVQNYIKKYEMLRPGDRVIVALSGGADSVCLLWVLHTLRQKWKEVELRAVHVHHGLRGEEADRDARFVQELCERLRIPLKIVYYDVALYAKQQGLSAEEAGRLLRYEAFAKEAQCWECETASLQKSDVRIALAHHRDDNAETVLHHLLRGSGLKGLAGIRPVQGSRIRPLLCVSRAEILEYLEQEGLSWCEDSTNESSDYTRNRIRNLLIPQMTEQINRNAVENILHASEIIAQADAYLEMQARLVWQQAGQADPEPEDEKAETVRINRKIFCRQEPIIQTYVIRHMLNLVVPGWKNITSTHFYQVAQLAEKQVGKRLDLPCQITAFCDYEALILKRSVRVREEQECSWLALKLPEPDHETSRAQGLKLRTFSRKKGEEIPKNRYTKWFDYDKIKNTLFLRTRQTGDYLTLPGGGKKAITRYMIDEKIPREQRNVLPVLADGSHVLWVIGFRISEYYKVTNTTKTILEVKFDGGEYDGRESSSVIV